MSFVPDDPPLLDVPAYVLALLLDVPLTAEERRALAGELLRVARAEAQNANGARRANPDA